MIHFDDKQTSSIKLVAIQKNSIVNSTTRFMKGKMLIFSKTSVCSFVYDIIDVFCFSNEDKMKSVTSKNAPIIKTWPIEIVRLWFLFSFVTTCWKEKIIYRKLFTILSRTKNMTFWKPKLSLFAYARTYIY